MSIRQSNPVRLIDIAREVKLSSAVVSTVLSGAHEGTIRVSAEKAAKIRATAERLHYTPNMLARALTGQKTKVLGVLVDSVAPGVTFGLLSEMEHYASLCGYRLLTGEAHDDLENLFENYRILKSHGADGVICLAHDYIHEHARIEEFFTGVKNVVFVYGPRVPHQVQVWVDIAGGISAAVELLKRKGRRKIAMLVDGRDYWAIRQRVEGFLRALPGHQDKLLFLQKLATQDAGQWEAELRSVVQKILLPERFDAVLAPNDTYALMLMTVLGGQAGRKIPEDIAVIGHDNEFFSACWNPALTTLDEDNAELARLAVDRLIQIVNGAAPADAAENPLVAFPKLIERQST